MDRATKALDFAQANTAEPKMVFTPTDAHNTYELMRLLVRRTEFSAPVGEMPVSFAAPERQGQPRLIASGDLAMR